MVDLLNSYFIIKNRGGDTTVTKLSREELLERMTPDKHGDVEIDGEKALARFPAEPDTGYWGERFLIIKGHIVHPRPVEVVKKYEI